MSATCDGCKFWEKLHGDQGGCRRFPPTVTPFQYLGYAGAELDPSPQLGHTSTFPQTKQDDWCGEYQPRKTPEPGPRPPPPPPPTKI